MKPQIFTLNSEALDEFRMKMDAALETVARKMIEKKLMDGTVTAKIEIEMTEKADRETGEIYYDAEITPKVNMKIAAGGKIECATKKLLMKTGRDRRTYVASNQVDIDELLAEQKEA